MEEPRWKRMMFKGCKVYAQVDGEGNPLARNGRITIKYQLGQEQEYQARPEAVQEIDEQALTKKSAGQHTRKKSPPPGANSVPPSVAAAGRSIIIYADGACQGNPGPAGIGVVLQYKDHRKEISRSIGHGTNNIAELIAIKTALQEIKDPSLPVYLHTDSAYCCNVLDGRWKAKENKELIKEIQKEMTRFPHLTLVKVAGHSGVEGNEQADRLAREGISKNAPSGENNN